MDQHWGQHDLTRLDVDPPRAAAITLHEAIHGFVAHRCGDDTAGASAGSPSSPEHIDRVRTILLPLVLFLHAPFPVRLCQARSGQVRRLAPSARDMVWVAGRACHEHLLRSWRRCW